MKRYLLIGFALSVVQMSLAWAQPVLDVCHHLPEPGDIFKLESFVCDTANVTAGPAGPNRYWDFSHWVRNNGGIAFDTIVDPQATPYFNLFPDADIAELPGGPDYHYWAVSDSQINFLGNASPLYSVPIVYTDPELQWVCPFEYGEQFYDEIKFEVGPFRRFKGNKTVSYDAYGILKLPNLQYFNVVRMHTTSIMVTGPYGSIHDDYVWFETTYFQPVCSLTRYTNLDRAVWAKVPRISLYTPMPPVGTLEAASEMAEISPNPAHDYIHVRTGPSLQSGVLLLHDIYGREVLRHRVSSRESEVDLTALATGVYMGRLITPKGMVIETGKIVKE